MTATASSSLPHAKPSTLITWLWGVVATTATACASSSGPGDIDKGAKLFSSGDLSRSGANFYTCATCHDAGTSQATMPPIKSGGRLAGVTRRPSFWGGMESDLLAAVDDCRRTFMSDPSALQRDDAAAVALYAFLVSLDPGEPAAVPFTVLANIENVARGNADQGRALFGSACGGCHGELHTASGRLSPVVPSLPEDAIASHVGYDAMTLRLVVIEKVRHGKFFGYSGVMPPYSEQVLPDARLGDILEALGLTGVAP